MTIERETLFVAHFDILGMSSIVEVKDKYRHTIRFLNEHLIRHITT